MAGGLHKRTHGGQAGRHAKRPVRAAGPVSEHLGARYGVLPGAERITGGHGEEEEQKQVPELDGTSPPPRRRLAFSVIIPEFPHYLQMEVIRTVLPSNGSLSARTCNTLQIVSPAAVQTLWRGKQH